MNLNNLSERELLILLNQQVQSMSEEIRALKSTAADLQALEKRVLTQEIKWRTWASVLGLASGAIGAIISKFIKI